MEGNNCQEESQDAPVKKTAQLRQRAALRGVTGSEKPQQLPVTPCIHQSHWVSSYFPLAHNLPSDTHNRQTAVHPTTRAHPFKLRPQRRTRSEPSEI